MTSTAANVTETVTIRPARWPEDAALLSNLDTSFVTETIYRPLWDGLSCRWIEEACDPPRRKTYAFWPDDPRETQDWDCALVAEAAGHMIGFAAAGLSSWNRRVEIQHLYVAPAHRRQGVGHQLLDALGDYAQSVNARCLWLETQNVNMLAVRFYQRVGFQFCGFDTSLYDPSVVSPDEIALFFSRPVTESKAGKILCA